MTGSLRAEWTKLWTVPSTAWLLLGAFAATIGAGAGYASSVRTSHCPAPAECLADLPRISLTGVQLGQVAVVVLAVLVVSNEYSTRMIGTTLLARPRRLLVLLAKAGVVTVVVLAAGALAVAGSLLAGDLILPGNGFTVANGYPQLSLTDGPTLRAAGGTVVYLGLVGLLGLGIAVIVRDTAAALVTVLGLLFVVPVVAELVTDPVWAERLERFGPSTAGLSIQATTGLDRLAIAPWPGLGVLAAYAAAALVAGGALLLLRDA